jgi:chemosensory pili system protein ChpA (sensor histidine kinase/response regulator)
MISRDPHQDNPPDSLFNEEIFQLLDEEDGEEPIDPSGAIDSSEDSWFDSAFLAGTAEVPTTLGEVENLSGQLVAPASSLEDDISGLFNESFSWEEDDSAPSSSDFLDWSYLDPPKSFTPEAIANPVSALDSDEELFSLFGVDASDFSLSHGKSRADRGDGEPPEPRLETYQAVPFAPVPSPEISHPQAPSLVTPSLTSPLCLDFYEPIEHLETLIEQPATAARELPVDFAALASVIEAPALPAAPASLSVSGVVPASSEDSLDDEFKDLEKLLEQAEGAIGRKAIAASETTGQRLPSRAKPSKIKGFDQTMRVPVKQLDNLSNLIGELVIKRNRLEQDQERLHQFLDNLLNKVQSLSDVGERMQDLYERTLLEGALIASRHRNNPVPAIATYTDEEMTAPKPFAVSDPHNLDALEMDRFTGFHLLSQEMIELIVRVRESASDIQFVVDESDQVARSLRQVTTQLQEGMTHSRMVPFSQAAERFPRAVREVSLKLNKQVQLQVEGRDVLVDKMILEQLYNPMTHLINNAIAHGIESPQERQQRGKPPVGSLRVRGFLEGNQTLITVSDDGAGINAETVKAKAIQKGLIAPAEAATLTTQEIYDFLFHPGFSTKDQADDFAGRGVGLDVVRTSLSEVRGSVSIDSTPGKGTTFTIRLPLTLSICKALCCLSDHARIAFSMDGVEDMQDYAPNDMQSNAEGRRCIPWQGNLLPIYPLKELLSYNRQLRRGNVYGGKQQEDLIAIVILRSAGNLLAIQVDQVLGEQEIVIKQIEGPVPKPAGIAGATVLGDGSVMPIGDVLELIEIAHGRMRAESTGNLWKKTLVPMHFENALKTETTVLIVDDSITVRELLSLSFSKAGYRVEQARDGQEAWEKLRSGLPCDLVFCDIEMPRMNGLELLANLQKDEKLAAVPVALLTSRGADRHRQVAAKLGASGYFTKPYTEKDLLDAAQRLLQGEVLLQGSLKAPKYVPAPVEASPSQDLGGKNTGETPRASDLSVLIVDDSVMVREMLSMTFAKVGYRIEQARDGQEAWEKLREGLSCSLILCDIEMPRMNGLELLSRLQEDEKISQIPVAMITSRGAQKMKQIAAERGAKGYFVKPYIEEVLLDAAKRLIAGEVLLDRNHL